MTRFTKDFIQKVLEMNEGFTDRSYYKAITQKKKIFTRYQRKTNKTFL